MSQVGHTFVTVRRPLRAYIGSLPHRPPETRPGRPEPPGSRRKTRREKAPPGNPPAETAPGEPTPETDPGNRPRETHPPEPTRGNLPRKTYRREPTPGNRSAGTAPRAHPAGGTDPPPARLGHTGRGWSDPLVCLAGTAPCKRSRNRQKRGGGIKSGKEQKNAKKVLEGTLQKLP